MSDANEQWHLPIALQILTKEQMAEVEASQAELAKRVASPFAQISPAEQERAHAALIIKDLSGTLELLENGIKASIVNGDGYDILLEGKKAVSHQLAQAYASLGRFDKAAQYEADEGQALEYLKMWNAVWRDDEETCGCPALLAKGQHKGSYSQTFVKSDVWSVKHQKIMPMLKCTACGQMNVAPLPKEIAVQRAARAQARALVGEMNPHDAKATLLKHGHTTEKLLA